MNTFLSETISRGKSTGWKAELLLEFKNPGGKSILGACRRMGPLTFQRPFYPEGNICHLYLLHPPGGIVGGDNIFLEAGIKQGACALVTTPGATKFYRSAGAKAYQTQIFYIASGGVLEWFPQETIVFQGAIPVVQTEINLETDAVFFGWDILCLGRPVNGELFNKGSLRTRFTIKQNGLPLYSDHIRIENKSETGKELESLPGMRGFPVTATFIATGVNKKILEDLRSIPEVSKDNKNSYLTGMTLIKNLLIVRYLGNDPSEAKRFFIIIWGFLRKVVLKRDICVPRIWAT